MNVGLSVPAPAALPRLTVVLITRNEARNIVACLQSVAFANEWCIVDSGSQDGTPDLARAMGARVQVVDDWPGFGPQKNRALDMARGEWVLALDADERIPAALAEEIQALLRNPGSIDAASMPRLTAFCGQWIHHCGWTPDRLIRLFKRGTARYSNDLVHERLLLGPTSVVQRLNHPLRHHSYPDMDSYWRKLMQYSQLWAAQAHRAGRRTTVGRAVLSGAVAFVRTYVFKLGFLDGRLGLVVCVMQAQATFAKYAALYCLHLNKDRQHDQD